jgi:hypothetical protein
VSQLDGFDIGLTQLARALREAALAANTRAAQAACDAPSSDDLRACAAHSHQRAPARRRAYARPRARVLARSGVRRRPCGGANERAHARLGSAACARVLTSVRARPALSLLHVLRAAPQIFNDYFGVGVAYLPYPDTSSMCACAPAALSCGATRACDG